MISQFLRSLLSLLLLPLLLWGCTNLETPQFEAKVLEVIKQNPQAILDSVQAYQKSERDRQSQLQQQTLSQIQAQPQNFVQGSPTKGNPKQLLILMEFSDFQCPFCAKAHDTVQAFMAKNSDRITLVYKHFPLNNIHPQATPAALASWAALQQNQFWQFHDQLFANQAQLGDQLYTDIATKLQLNLDKFNGDRSSAAAQAAINQDLELGKAIGVPGTPFFLVNGVPLPTSENLLSDLETATKS